MRIGHFYGTSSSRRGSQCVRIFQTSIFHIIFWNLHFTIFRCIRYQERNTLSTSNLTRSFTRRSRIQCSKVQHQHHEMIQIKFQLHRLTVSLIVWMTRIIQSSSYPSMTCHTVWRSAELYRMMQCDIESHAATCYQRDWWTIVLERIICTRHAMKWNTIGDWGLYKMQELSSLGKGCCKTGNFLICNVLAIRKNKLGHDSSKSQLK